LFSAPGSAKISVSVIVTGGAAPMPNEMTFIPEVYESNPIITIRFKYNPLLLGHDDIKTTMICAKVAQKDLRRHINEISINYRSRQKYRL
jgi:hypothetical protein